MRSLFLTLQCLDLLLRFSECSVEMEQEQFVKDLLHFAKGHRPAVVLSEPHMSSWNMDLLTLFISNDGFSDQSMIRKGLYGLIEDGEIDFILFWDTGHQKLIHGLAEEMKLFRSKVTCFVDMRDSGDFAHMTLASRLYYYSSQESGTVDVYESYKIRGGPTVTNAIGTWTAADGLQVSEPNIWERRSNLRGSTLRCATVKYPVLSNLTYGDDKRITSASGYYWEIFELLRAEMNFTADVRYSVDGKFGSVGKDGETWNGMVGMLMRDVFG